MSLNKLFISVLFLSLLPVQGQALFGLSGRSDQKQKISQARAAYADGEYKKTVEIAKDFLMQNQNAPKRRIRRIYVVLGDAYKALGDYDHALLTYNTALEYLPKDIGLNLALAEVYYETGLYDKATEIYQKVIMLEDDNSDALLGLARSYLKMGYLSRSRFYFKQYLEDNHKIDAATLYDYAYVNYLSGNYNFALEYALKSSEVKESAETYFLLAKIYRQLNAALLSKENINLATAFAPEREDIYLTKLLWLSYDKGSAPLALASVQNFLKDNPKSALGLFIEYVSLSKLDRRGEAQKVLKEINGLEGTSFIKDLSAKFLNR